MIIEREELKIEDEDSLLLFILRLYREDESYSTLFENVYFENVNEESLETFIDEFDIENMTNRTWKSISYRLIKSRTSEEKAKQNRYTKQTINNNDNILTFSPDSNKKFNGIDTNLASSFLIFS